MSGSTIGGVVGGVIGFYFGGAKGAQMGWMIGSAVGGYVDPDVIQGPRLNDAQTQTSMEGAPRAIVYGTAAIAGNIIMSGPLVETKHRERSGKGGGPVQETFVYTRTYAIAVCEGPIAGISRIWRDDKLVYDARDPADWPEAAADIASMAADSAKFASQITIHLGDESQLPSATLEALPASVGGGVGNVPSYRGTAYVVFANDDLTNRQGSIPQYRFEVASAGTSATTTQDSTIGAQTDAITLTGYGAGAYMAADAGGVRVWIDPTNVTAPGADIASYVLDDALNQNSGVTITNNTGFGFATTGAHLTGAYAVQTWQVGQSSDGDKFVLLNNGVMVADLRPSLATVADWHAQESLGIGEYGGLVWFNETDAYVGVRTTFRGTWNRIYQWAVEDALGAIVEPLNISPLVTAGSGIFFMHMDGAKTLRAIAIDEEELVTYDGGLVETARRDISATSPANIKAFAVDNNYLFLWKPTVFEVYDLTTLALLQTIVPVGSVATESSQIIVGPNSIFLRSGEYVKRIAYSPYCLVAAPPGWGPLPDSPGYLTDGVNVAPLCSSTSTTVTGDAVILSDIVTDLCGRVGVTSDQIDVSELTDVVRGFVVGRQSPAGDNIRALQRGYRFDFPEWGDYTDDTPILRGIKRGGATQFAITDDDLVESDDDEETRAQAIEFPRKINLITSDVDADYNPTKQTFERRTDNVKAVGETTIELPLALRRSEAAPIVDIMGKVAWTEAEGRTKLTLPEEFSALVPSDCFTFDGKRWRAEKCEYGDGTVAVEAVRDRASAYTSVATSGPAQTPTSPVTGLRGPTLGAFMNLPSLRTADNVPGMYVTGKGTFSGWAGYDLYLSTDGGLSEHLVLTAMNAGTFGRLTDSITSSSEPLSVDVGAGELDSITTEQLTSRLNGFAVLHSDATAEVGQFQTATETAAGRYDLTDLTRGQLNTTATAHTTGAQFVLLDSAVYFLPLDASLAGRTLIFRPVSRGTAIANNATYSVVFLPQFTEATAVSFLLDETGDFLADETGAFLQE